MKNKNKTLIIGILVIGFILAICIHRGYIRPLVKNVANTTPIATQTPVLVSSPETATETYDPKNYKNEKYGFEISFPDSWQYYAVISETWQGTMVNGDTKKYQGPKILLRSPKWTEAKPWQDIPVLIFTPEQWKLAENEELAVSAAPIGPSKLGENKNYVFALPPRWIGFTDALGQDEAAEIVKTFKAF